MGCNCRKNKTIYTGPPVETVAQSTTSQTGGQPPIPENVVAAAQPSAQSR